jgi:hypothetical protein
VRFPPAGEPRLRRRMREVGGRKPYGAGRTEALNRRREFAR